jgi:hypothetical protein
MAAPSKDDALAYQWWVQGAHDEAKARDQGYSTGLRELRECLEALDQLNKHSPGATELALQLARIYCPDRLKRRHRG